MRKLTFIMLMVCLIITFNVLAVNADSVSSKFIYARKLFNLKDYTNAIKAFHKVTRVTSLKKWVAPAYYYLGLSYFNNHQYKESETSFKKLLRSYPASFFTNNAKMKLKEIRKMSTNQKPEDKSSTVKNEILQKKTNTEQAAEISANQPNSNTNSTNQNQKGNLRDEVKNTIISVQNNADYTDNKMVNPYQQKLKGFNSEVKEIKTDIKNPIEKIKSENKVIKRKQAEFDLAKKVEEIILKGNIYTENENYTDALKAYKKALELDPSNTTALFNIGVIYMKKKIYDHANTIFEKVYRKQPNDIETLIYLAATFQKLDKYIMAKIYWNRVLQKAPDNSIAKHNIQLLNKITTN